MRFARSLLLSTLSLYFGIVSLAAADEIDAAAQPVAVVDQGSAQIIPEPNTMLFAGIGGIILLIFAIRRKA